MTDPGQDSRGKNRATATIVGALIAVALGLAIVVRASRPSEPASPSGPPMTTVMISSEPAGATVTGADGGLLGVTPFELTVPKINGEMPVLVRREGYQEHRVSVPLFSLTGRIDVMMTAVGAEPPPPPKPLPRDWTP